MRILDLEEADTKSLIDSREWSRAEMCGETKQ